MSAPLDIEDPPWAGVVVDSGTEFEAAERALGARVLAEPTGAHRTATLDRYLREISGHPSIEEVSPTAPEIIDP